MSNESASTEDAFVTVGRYNDSAGAQMARAALEAAGIEGFLQGENANSLLPPAFRARLLVNAADEATAAEVLRTADLRPFTESEVLAAEQADEIAHPGSSQA